MEEFINLLVVVFHWRRSAGVLDLSCGTSGLPLSVPEILPAS